MQINKVEIDGQNILRLPNDFIEAVYSLSVDAKKVFLSLCLHLNDKNEIRVHVSNIDREVGIKVEHLNQRHFKKILKELMSKIIEIKDVDDRNKWKLTVLIKEIDYDNGVLTAEISKTLLPYFKIAQERLFTRFNIQNIKPLTSIYAIRLYELAKQYQDTGWRIDSIEDFRKMLQLDGKYKDNKDFRKYVLEVAKKQINERTDIKIDYELIKEGRRFTKIKWRISQDKKRVQKQATKNLQKLDPLQELETNLNRTYKDKSFRGENGLNWYILRIKIADKDTVEVIATDLQETKTFKMTIKELENLQNPQE